MNYLKQVLLSFQSSPQKNSANTNAGGSNAKKRARIEFDVGEHDEDATAEIAEDKPETASRPAKRKWVNKKVQQQQPTPSELQTKKNLGVKARVGPGPVKNKALQRPAPGRFQGGGQSNRGFQNNRGGRSGPTPPRMAQVPSPWAVPHVQNWFGGGY